MMRAMIMSTVNFETLLVNKGLLTETTGVHQEETVITMICVLVPLQGLFTAKNSLTLITVVILLFVSQTGFPCPVSPKSVTIDKIAVTLLAVITRLSPQRGGRGQRVVIRKRFSVCFKFFLTDLVVYVGGKVISVRQDIVNVEGIGNFNIYHF